MLTQERIDELRAAGERVCRLLEGETLSRLNPGPADDAESIRSLLAALEESQAEVRRLRAIAPLADGACPYCGENISNWRATKET